MGDSSHPLAWAGSQRGQRAQVNLSRDGSGDAAESVLSPDELRGQLERARITLDFVTDAVVGADRHGQIDYLNGAAERLFGCGLAHLRGRTADDAFSLHSVETHARLANPVSRCLDHGRPIQRAGGSLLAVAGQPPVPVQERVVPLHNPAGRILGAVLVMRDLSRETGLNEQLRWRSRHDTLTGLLNREEFERRLTHEVNRVRSGIANHSLLYLDIDRFRVINDTSGHVVGDRALLDVARLLQDHVRTSDLCARLGDDEFAVLLRDCPPGNALQVAAAIRTALDRHRVNWCSRSLRLTASIGVVGIEPGMDTDAVLAAADVACYAAKDSGRNAVSHYSARETPVGYRDMQWVQRLVRACDEGQFQLYCQPIVPIGAVDTRAPHYELLLRLHEPDGVVVPPADFLPAAERFNLMPTIDRWVLRHALQNLARRRIDVNLPAYKIAVNLSGTSLSDQSFLDFAVSELKRADLAAHALCFEITETAAIENIAAVVRFMREMRQLGCEFSLDDFGSGLSSLAYLRELPVDYLKIDGRFVHNLHTDKVNYTMVRAISHLSAAIGVKTVAERVESRETIGRLQSLGIDFAQGYYFSRPVLVRDRQSLAALARTLPEGGD